VALFWCKYITDKMKELEPETDDELTAEEKTEATEALKFVARMTGYLLGRLAGFSDSTAAKIEALFRDVGHGLDDDFELFYVRDMLDRIPRMVARTFKLSQIMPSKNVSKSTDLYLKEATRSYIFGFWDASVALSRAALEDALRIATRERSIAVSQDLRHLVKHAGVHGLLDRPTTDFANDVRSAANRVLHGRPAKEEEAWDVLCKARGVLEHLYSCR